MLLTSQLAQPIVDSVMPIALQNINIMDSHGMIIASGHTHRINTFHKGAKDVIHSGQTVEIFPKDLEQYTGSLPGLNMPIVLNDQVIGVVGISGHPDEVRDLARMVKMVTELILQQEVLQEEIRSQFQLRENFATLLLSDHASSNHDKLVKTGALLKFQLDLPRLVFVIDSQPLLDMAFDTYGLNDLVSSRARENLIQIISMPPYIEGQDLVVFIENKLIILKHFENKALETLYKKWASDLLERLNPCNILLQLGMGSLAAHYTGLSQSYQEALFSLHGDSSKNGIPSIYDFDILSAYLLKKLDTNTLCQPLELIKEKLDSNLTRKYDMKNTVIHLLNNNLSITNTSKSLYIHRNTLLFRLNKLKDATGLDPCRFLNHAFLCKIIFEQPLR